MVFSFKAIKAAIKAGSLALLASLALPSHSLAAGDTPFFTGVWELKDGTTIRPLVMSDWLIFDKKMPSTWLYMRQNSIPGERYQFFARNISVNGLSQAIVDVAKVDDQHILYRLSANGRVIEQGEATRLSVPNAGKSCLAVDTEPKDLMGTWTILSKGKKNTKLKLSDKQLTIGKEKRTIISQPLRTGQLGLLTESGPFALFTDAGGDYAVLQILPQGTKAFVGGTIGQHVNFQDEIILRRAKGRCDAAIDGRLKLLGKPRKQAKAKK